MRFNKAHVLHIDCPQGQLRKYSVAVKSWSTSTTFYLFIYTHCFSLEITQFFFNKRFISKLSSAFTLCKWLAVVHVQMCSHNEDSWYKKTWLYACVLDSAMFVCRHNQVQTSFGCHYVVILWSGSPRLCDYSPREVFLYLAKWKHCRIKAANNIYN